MKVTPRHLAIAGALALGVAGAGMAQRTASVPAPQAIQCHVQPGNRPDPACSPGEVLPLVTKDQVCTPGYAGAARNVPDSLKAAVLAEYGMSRADADIEVDHVVPLAIGGSNSIRNLFPQPADPRPGFHEKDRLEWSAHRLVCNGRIGLADAQRRMSSDWLGWYQELQQQGEL